MFKLKTTMIVAALFASGCSLTAGAEDAAPVAPALAVGNELQPIIPTQLAKFDTGGAFVNTPVASNCSTDDKTKKALLGKLGNTRIHAYNYIKEAGKTNFSYMTAKGRINKGTEIIQVYDYIKYTGTNVGTKSAIEGIGYRLQFHYMAEEKNVDLGGIFNVSANYAKGKISGTVNIDVIGIAGEPVDSALPGGPLKINEDNVLSLFDDIGKIKASIYNSSVHVCPQVTAISAPDAALKLF